MAVCTAYRHGATHWGGLQLRRCIAATASGMATWLAVRCGIAISTRLSARRDVFYGTATAVHIFTRSGHAESRSRAGWQVCMPRVLLDAWPRASDRPLNQPAAGGLFRVWAGGMLAPYCEGEREEPLVRPRSKRRMCGRRYVSLSAAARLSVSPGGTQ